jgi:hypothetical protein
MEEDADLPPLITQTRPRRGQQGWVLCFASDADRDWWFDEIIQSQHKLAMMEADNPLLKEIEVGGDAPRSRCAIM